MRLPFNRIIIHRGRLRWLLRQELMFHHFLLFNNLDGFEDNDELTKVYPKNSKPIYCKCKGCESLDDTQGPF
jgi:hypothetical protein